MNADTLPELAKLLKHGVPSHTRAATCAAITGCTAGCGGAALRGTIATSDAGVTIIGRLLVLSSDPMCAQLALYALVNLSEDEAGTRAIVAANGVKLCMDELGEATGDVDLLPRMQTLSSLLSNLTRHPVGVKAFLGVVHPSDGDSDVEVPTEAEKAEFAILKMLHRIDAIPNVLWLENACTISEGRTRLLLSPTPKSPDLHPLARALSLMSNADTARRLAAAGLFRNCAMAPECHQALLFNTNALGISLARLVARHSPLDLEDIKDAPAEVLEAVVQSCAAEGATHGAEDVVKVRVQIVEALLLLSKSEIGLELFRERDVTLVLFEWSKVESEEEINNMLGIIMNRTAVSAERKVDDGAVSVDA